MSLLILGARRSGKSTIVNLFTGNDQNGQAPPPTDGINWESFQFGEQHFRILEIGGISDSGQRWQDIIKQHHGVILVSDGNLRNQIKEAK